MSADTMHMVIDSFYHSWAHHIFFGQPNGREMLVNGGTHDISLLARDSPFGGSEAGCQQPLGSNLPLFSSLEFPVLSASNIHPVRRPSSPPHSSRRPRANLQVNDKNNNNATPILTDHQSFDSVRDPESSNSQLYGT